MNRPTGTAGAPVPKRGCWPTRQQEWLLRASLLEGDSAVEAWEVWHSKADVDRLDAGSVRLLPLLYSNLKRHGLDPPVMEKLKGTYRLTWYKNQMLFRSMAGLLKRFHDSGIQTLVLKGVPIVLLHYRDLGLRPMQDVDLLVSTREAMEAVELLSRLGWRLKPGGPLKAVSEGLLSVLHGEAFVDDSENHLDLHWHVLAECCYEGADEEWWDGSRAIEVQGIQTRALNATDTLFQICVHGTCWNPVPPLRWVADAMVVLRTSGADIDWERLVAQAGRRRLVEQLRNTLGYLRGLLDAPVPRSVVERLQAMPVSGVERWEYRVRGRPPGLSGSLLHNWFLYLRSSQLARPSVVRPRLRGFPSYLKAVWGVGSLWQVPVEFLRKGLGRICKSLGRKR
jgi:hypothetical protein